MILGEKSIARKQVPGAIALFTIFYGESAITQSLDIVSGCTGIITAVPAVSPKKT